MSIQRITDGELTGVRARMLGLDRKRFLQGITLVSCTVLSVAFNFYQIDFPVGYHNDEQKKAHFVLTGEQDFHHPLLLIQAVRLVNLFADVRDRDQIVILGRCAVAGMAATVPLLCFLLFRRWMNETWSLFGAFGVATSPTIVIHAHYFKEDLVFLPCLLFSLLGFARWQEGRRNGWATFAVGAGLAAAASYKTALLLAIYAAVVLANRGERRMALARNWCAAFLVAAGIFLVLNYPLLADLSGFANGVRHESLHLATGHTLRIAPWHYYFCFHFVHGIVSGIGLPLAVLGLGGMLLAAFHWRDCPASLRVCLLWTFAYYAVAECGLSKPPPDLERYMVSVAPLWIGFAVLAMARLASSKNRRWPIRAFGRLAPVALGLALWDTMLLVQHLKHDTRQAAADWIERQRATAVFERYASLAPDVANISDFDTSTAQGLGVRYFVASSFTYDRYLRGLSLPGQRAKVYRIGRKYQLMFRRPYIELAPVHREFGFSNPTIRIVDLHSSSREE